ncbi:MAG: tryptophan 2,3-dioxygenase [Candidatus Melainabacteria bacterium HGW-Melainabacteria-1]|nr:MAG: tryptophan 2,3-dioxygenase [Candidatus Melainabacteria bacterium HGW-Melainabacteria-1]
MSGNTYYGDYLGLEKLLSAQNPRSDAMGRPAHDEMLFIVTHQVYELWFKLILHELNSVLLILQQPFVADTELSTAVARLERVIDIQKHLINQLEIMETMTPLDFLEFRDLLVPASGFQSFQFRVLENRLGLAREQRLKYHQSHYTQSLSEAHQELIRESESAPNLFGVIERWLERTPFLRFGDFDFWHSYGEAVTQMFTQDRERVHQHTHLSEKEVAFRLRQLEATEATFASLFDPQAYAEQQREGRRRLSYQATQAALLILLYRELPMLQMPHRLLTSLMSIDELLNTWRYRHALMVQHMIGSKQGTGGSMGYDYLIQTLDAHRIFSDLIQLTTYLIPRSSLPELPGEILQQLGFAYRGAQP